MRVLFVAPRTDLMFVNEEAQDVLTSGLSVEPMMGDVSGIDLARRLRLDKFDVLWLATHGDQTGVLLSDGILKSSTIVQLVRDKVDLVFLNTCESYGVAQMLQNETGATIVCTVAKVPDSDAYHTASLFASALHETGDARLAYDRSRPGNNTTYLFLAGKKKQGRKLSARK